MREFEEITEGSGPKCPDAVAASKEARPGLPQGKQTDYFEKGVREEDPVANSPDHFIRRRALDPAKWVRPTRTSAWRWSPLAGSRAS